MRVVRSLLGEIQRYSIELRTVRSLLGEMCEVDKVGSCKEFVRRLQGILIELRAVRSLLGEVFRGIR